MSMVFDLATLARASSRKSRQAGLFDIVEQIRSILLVSVSSPNLWDGSGGYQVGASVQRH